MNQETSTSQTYQTPPTSQPIQVEEKSVPIGVVGTRAVKPGVAFKLRDGSIYVNDENGTVWSLKRKKKKKSGKRKRRWGY
jgi:hypothetical protein